MLAGAVNRYVIQALRATTFILALLVTGMSCGSTAEGDDQKLRVFIHDADSLLSLRQQVRTGDRDLSLLVDQLRSDADQALRAGPFSVTNKLFTPPSGDKHDYMSLSPYWWPDPSTPDGLPYVRRDGVVNPERNEYDRIPLGLLADNVITLAATYFYTGHEPYAIRAAELIRIWFIEPDTRMNPHLEYGQAIPGRSEGRNFGIIEARSLSRIAEVVGLLHGSESWTVEDQRLLQGWYNTFLDWLLDSDKGQAEAAAPNNHGTWYDVTAAHLAMFTEHEDVARDILAAVPERRIEKQIKPDGSQPLELHRTRSYSYSVMNLKGLYLTALLGERVGLDIWSLDSEAGRKLKAALDYLLPHSLEGQAWPYEQIRGWEPKNMVNLDFLMRLAAEKFKEPAYSDRLLDIPEIDLPMWSVKLIYPL
ncbi:alginate lyase family protein [Candidatus Neomarinimicrobiota bacterium]